MRGIYKIINRKNGKYYVGSSVNIHERWNEHRRTLREGTHINPKLQASWKRNGEPKFDFVSVELVAEGPRHTLLEVE